MQNKLQNIFTYALFVLSLGFMLIATKFSWFYGKYYMLCVLLPLAIFSLALMKNDQRRVAWDNTMQFGSFLIPWLIGMGFVAFAHPRGIINYYIVPCFIVLTVFASLSTIPIKRQTVYTAFAITNILCGCVVIYKFRILGVDDTNLFGYVRIIFIGIMTLLSNLCVCYLCFHNKHNTSSIIIFLGAIFGYISIALSGVRTAFVGFLALPLIIFYIKDKRLRIKIFSFFSIIFTLLVLYLTYSGRFGEAIRDLVLYQDGIKTTSIGQRFEMWRASIDIFMTNPLCGLGYNPLEQLESSLAASQYIKEIFQFHKAHSDLFTGLATGGISFLIGWVATNGLLLYRYRKTPSVVLMLLTILFLGLTDSFWLGKQGLPIILFVLAFLCLMEKDTSIHKEAITIKRDEI